MGWNKDQDEDGEVIELIVGDMEYSHDQNYWRITDFFTKSSNRPTHASNLTVWSISPQPGHFFSF